MSRERPNNGIHPYTKPGEFWWPDERDTFPYGLYARPCGCGCGKPAEMVNPAPSLGVPDDWAEACWTRHCFTRHLDPFTGLPRLWRIDDDLTVSCMFCGQPLADLFTACRDTACITQTTSMRRASELMDISFGRVPCLDIAMKRASDDANEWWDNEREL